MKRFCVIFILALVLAVTAGCGGGKNQVKPEELKVELSEKEKEILRESGLPEEYENLTETQQKSIRSIGQMLTYAENKYAASFKFKGYEIGDALAGEELILYPEGGDDILDLFWVRPDGEGNYTDGYMNVYVRPAANEFVLAGVKAIAGTDNVKIYSTVSSTDLEYGKISQEDIPEHVNADNMIFIAGEGIDREKAEAVADRIIEFLEGNGIYGLNQLIILNEGVIDLLTAYNYTDYLMNTYYSYRMDCNVQETE